MRTFVAGATGALGRPLVRALVAAGHEVVGTTRSADRVALIEADGGRGVVCDALDRDAELRAVADAAPDVVIHELTDLPSKFARLRRGSEGTNRLRRDGTRHLVEAATAAGARRVIAESIAFLYAPGPGLADEDAPLQTDAAEPYRSMMAAVQDLERVVTTASGVEGVVLRYGALYGPGTWFAKDGDMINQIRRRRVPVVGSGNGVTSFLHVRDAARATVRALDAGPPGAYNVVDDDPVTYRELLPALAGMVGAKPPLHVPAWLVRAIAGSVAVATLTEQRGASNAKAKRELGWQPGYASWRQGFAEELG